MRWKLDHHMTQWNAGRSCWAFVKDDSRGDNFSEPGSPESIFFLLDSYKYAVDAQMIGRRIKQISTAGSPFAMILLELLDQEGKSCE